MNLIIKEYRDEEESKMLLKNKIPSERTYNLGYLMRLTLMAAIGGFLFGYDTGVIGGANLYINTDEDPQFRDVTNEQKELIVSLAVFGGAVGAIFIGPLSDIIGRKFTIMIADVLFTVGAVMMWRCPNVGTLMAGRFIIGVAVGAASMIVPVYLAESSPTSIRGSIVTLNIAFVTGGQLLALLICFALKPHWRIMLGLAGLPSAIQFILMLTVPESPRFLMKKGKITEARTVLEKIYNIEKDPGRMEMEMEISQINDALAEEEGKKQSTYLRFKELFIVYRKIVFIGMMLQVWQQLAGINTAMYYGPQMMQQAGFGDENDKDTTLVASLPLGALNFIGTLVAICYVDKMGRRYTMIRGLLMCALGMAGLGSGLWIKASGYDDAGKWMAAFSLFFYLLFFAIGMGSQPWTVNSEIYPLHLRGTGNSLSTLANWVSNYAVSAVFLTVTSSEVGKVLTYFILAFFCISASLFIYFLLPETKGRTLNEIIDLLIPVEKRKRAEKEFQKHISVNDQDSDSSRIEKYEKKCQE